MFRFTPRSVLPRFTLLVIGRQPPKHCVNRRFARNTEIKFVQGVNIVTVKDLARLDAVGPVLLMRSGILRKGLPAQWQ